MDVPIATGPDAFCLYLWRSENSPGTLYLAPSLRSAQAVCAELLEAGYIVKVVHLGSDQEYRMRNGRLRPAPPRPISRPDRVHSTVARPRAAYQ